MSKKVPNPNGKKGSLEHQAKIKEIEKNLEKLGFTVKLEYYIKTMAGMKNRYVDLAAFEKRTKRLVELHQVGKTKANGEAVKRKQEAIEDIKKTTGKDVIFHAFKILLIISTIATSTYYFLINN